MAHITFPFAMAKSVGGHTVDKASAIASAVLENYPLLLLCDLPIS